MASPNVFALFNQPNVALLDPYELQRRKLAIANALAAQQIQQQQIQTGAIGLENAQRDQAADAALRAAYAQPQAIRAGVPPPAAAAAPALPAAGGSVLPGAPGSGSSAWSPEMAAPALAATPGAAPPPAAPMAPADAPAAAPAPHELSDAEILNIKGAAGYGLIAARNAAKEKQAAYEKAQGEVESHDRDYWGSLAYGVQHSNYDPGVIQAVLSQAVADKKQNTPQFQALVGALRSGDGGRVQGLVESAIASSPEQQKLLNERTTAEAHKKTSDIQGEKETQALFQQKLSTAGQLLGSTRDQRSYEAAMKGLDPEIAKYFDQQWTPQAAANAQQKGMSAQEQVTTAEAAKRDAQTAANEAAQIGIQRAHLGIALRAEQAKKVGSDLASLPPDERAIAEKLASGEYRMTILGRFPADQKERIMGAAFKLNQNLSDQTYETRDSFTNPDKKQALNLGTISRIVGHIGRYEANSGRLGVAPGFGLGFTVTGDQKAIAADSHAIAAELEKLTSGGVGTKEQVKEWQDLLRSSIPENRQRAVDEISQLIGSQYEGMNQSWRAAMGTDIPIARYVSPAGRAWMKSKGLQVGGDDPAAAAPAAGPGGAPAAANGKPLAEHSTEELFNLLAK